MCQCQHSVSVPVSRLNPFYSRHHIHAVLALGSQAVEQGPILNRLQRTGRFLYEVVCAFVVHDLDGLLQRHMRKAAAGFAKLTE